MPNFRPRGFGPARLFISTTQGASTVPVVSVVSPNSDRTTGGASITITGANFRVMADGTIPLVNIGGQLATSVVVVDANTISCVVPAAIAAGLVDVTVTINGEIGTLAGGFSYYTSVVKSVSPAYGPIAGGTSVVIEGVNLLSGSTVSFGGNPATGVTFIDAQHIACVTPSHAQGHVDLVITEPSLNTLTLRNGFQYTLLTRGDDIRRQPGITINDKLGRQPNSCRFSVDGASNEPRTGERIEIIDSFDANRLLFAGTVVRSDLNYEGQTSQLRWDVEAVDGTWMLKKFYPVGRYVNVSASDIVVDLINRWAPGYTTTFVQTNLAKISIAFDGLRSLDMCLDDMAAAIGGGHWDCDYTNDIHFYHIPPANVVAPDTPETGLRVFGSMQPMSVQFTNPGLIGVAGVSFFQFFHTFVYDNGVESSLSIGSAVTRLAVGASYDHSNIPIGVTIGTHAVVKRRIYYRLNNGDLRQYCQINDNTTTAFTSGFKGVRPTVATVVGIPDGTPLPPRPYIAPPSKPTHPPLAALSATSMNASPTHVDGSGSFTYTGGSATFQISYVYQDGTESLPSDVSNLITIDGSHAFDLSNIPVGPPINGVNVVARLVYATWYAGWAAPGSPGTVVLTWIIPDNTTVASTVFMGLAIDDSARLPKVNPAASGNNVIWPNVDGPFLEGGNLPAVIDDANADLLREPQVSKTEDITQIRNRVTVTGAGSLTTKAVNQGGFTIPVGDLSKFGPTGGQLIERMTGTVHRYTGVEAVTGEGSIFLDVSSPLTADLPEGTPIDNYIALEDREAQRELSKRELDVNGNPTDGVHTFPIVDRSLITPFQLYQRAAAELELFAWPIVTVRYATRDRNTKAGKTVKFNLTNPPIVGEFLIQDVTIDQIHDESDQLLPRYTATASSTRFELNDLLLMILSGQQQQSSSPTPSSPTGTIAAAVAQSADYTDQQVTLRAGGQNLLVGTLTLTDAQIRSLGSKPVIIVPGVPGMIIDVLDAWSYTNQVTTYNLAPGVTIGWAANNDGSGATTAVITGFTSNTIIGGTGTQRYCYSSPVNAAAVTINAVPSSNMVGKPVVISGSDITGGNIANVIRVQILYRLIQAADLGVFP